MRVAIMQPYLFPYLGYFQLMDAVDCFVFFDDAQYMKGGWINRNRILLGGAPRWWTYPVIREDYTLPIRQRRYDRSMETDVSFIGKIEAAYRGAPGRDQGVALVRSCFDNPENIVSRFNARQLVEVASLLGIDCDFLVSSELEYDRSLSGQDRVIELCTRLGASHYVNSMGGVALYQRSRFEQAGIELCFLRPRLPAYAQFGAPHVPLLSVVDVLMFNSLQASRAMLAERELEGASA